MNQQIRDTISKILSMPDRLNRFDPGYGYWIAGQVWEAATQHERKRCAMVSGPKCAEAILEAAGVVCCEQNEQAGPGWFAVDNTQSVEL